MWPNDETRRPGEVKFPDSEYSETISVDFRVKKPTATPTPTTTTPTPTTTPAPSATDLCQVWAYFFSSCEQSPTPTPAPPANDWCYFNSMCSPTPTPIATPTKSPSPRPTVCHKRSDWHGRHTVQAGETHTSIAGQYGTSVDALARADCIANPNLIQINWELRVPGPSAKPTERPALPTTALSIQTRCAY